MILEEETFREFGYYSKDLKSKSSKRVLAKCEKCGKIRENRFWSYRDLCLPCSRQTEEYKQKMSKLHKGMKHTDEAKLKMSESHKKMSDSTKKKMSESHIGNIFSEESKRKLSKSLKGKYVGELSSMWGRTGDKNPNWRGGISFEPYCTKFDDDFKERVREYFGRCCYICGKNEEDNNEKLSVHHVNYNKQSCCDDSTPLFVPLCRACHSKTNFDRGYWQEFFTVSLEYLTNGKCY